MNVCVCVCGTLSNVEGIATPFSYAHHIHFYVYISRNIIDFVTRFPRSPMHSLRCYFAFFSDIEKNFGHLYIQLLGLI